MMLMLGLGRTNSPTSARHGDGLGYIRIWATPPKWLVFWDGSLSPSIGIKSSQVRRGIVCWFRGHQLLFSGDRVSISKQRWDCLWDRVSISKQRVDRSRNQFEGVDSFGNSSRVLRGGKDPIFI